MIGTGAKVLCMGGTEHREPGERLDAFWHRLEKEGWLGFRGPHGKVVIQIGQAARTAALLATGRSLAGRLTQLLPGVAVEIVDRAAAPNEWGTFRVRDLTDEETYCLTAISVSQGLRVPALWLEACALVTLTGVSPSLTSGAASILEAQAEPLQHLGNTGAPAALAYEAHRLAASDLAIVCCEAEPTSTEPAALAASLDDVALEHAVLTSASIVPATAPHFQELLRHELAPPPPSIEGQLPALRRCALPHAQVRRAAWESRARASGHAVLHDMRNLQGNLHKIPAFVRRRIQTWRSQRSGT